MSSHLIIGANRGIGLEFVSQLLANKSVGHVYATARTPSAAKDLQALATANKGRLDILSLEMTSESSVKAAAAELKKLTSSVDRVVVNAGILNGRGDILTVSPAELKEGLDVNVVGPLLVGQAFSPFLLESKAEKRQLVFMSSLVGSVTALPQVAGFLQAAFKAPFYPIGNYAVTKTALNMVGRQFGLRLEPQGVSVVLIHPGLVDTDMNDGTPKEALVSQKNSISGMLSALDNIKLGDGANGILDYEGNVKPW